MILFNISGSALGKNIIRGERLTFDDVLLALGLVEQYSRTVTVSINITSKVEEKYSEPNDFIDAILFNEFMRGARRPHLIYLEDHKITLPNGTDVYKDKALGNAYDIKGGRYDL